MQAANKAADETKDAMDSNLSRAESHAKAEAEKEAAVILYGNCSHSYSMELLHWFFNISSKDRCVFQSLFPKKFELNQGRDGLEPLSGREPCQGRGRERGCGIAPPLFLLMVLLMFRGSSQKEAWCFTEGFADV